MNREIFYHLNSSRFFFWIFALIFCGQLFFSAHFQSLQAKIEIVPAAPSKQAAAILSFGDNEFLFRILSARLQNSGDVFAGFASLKNYNYARIYDWMTMLDGLNNQSKLVPALASYYYSQTPQIQDVRYVVKYLDEHSEKNIDANWWWLFQAVFIAKDILKDLDLALKLAQKLAQNNAENAPIWTKQMPAFILEKQGQGCLAFNSIKKLIDESESGKRKISANEMEFMRYFIKERLQKLQNQKFDPSKC